MNFDLKTLQSFGQSIGRSLRGGECIELVGDVGTGKTTLVKSIALGLGVKDDVQSPSFTISRQYEARDSLRLVHYDFYRLSDPGIMTHELSEVLSDTGVVTIIEWAETVQSVLPVDRIQINLAYSSDIQTRDVEYKIPDNLSYLEMSV